jgi:hypothetical protein
MQPQLCELLQRAGIETAPVGFYDAPDPRPFAPTIAPPAVTSRASRACVFAFYERWQQGQTLHITRERHGCRGAARWLFDLETRPRQSFVEFLADGEGLKASQELMGCWIDHQSPYRQQHPHILIGPLREGQYEYLKSVTFFVNPDQLSLLMLGAQYHSWPDDPLPVIAPFGSGCMQLVTLFDDLDIPQAVLGATDIAMRSYLPPDILALTVTTPMFEQLCALDERSFLHKPFWARLREARSHRRGE